MPEGAEQDFEIPLRRPYAPLVIGVALLLPLGLMGLLARPRGLHGWALKSLGAWVCLAASAFLSVVLFGLARVARFALVATLETLTLPPRFPWLGVRPRVLAWRDVLRIELAVRGHVRVRTTRGNVIVPGYWLGGAKRAKITGQALADRMTLAHHRLGRPVQ